MYVAKFDYTMKIVPKRYSAVKKTKWVLYVWYAMGCYSILLQRLGISLRN